MRPMRPAWLATSFMAVLVWTGCSSETSPGHTTSAGGLGGQAGAGGGAAGQGGTASGGGGGGVGGERPGPTELGPKVLVGDGTDPDVAVDSLGRLHVAYVRSGTAYYRLIDYPGSVGPELEVGAGDDPQLVVDSQDRPHVVLGALYYTRRTGAAFEPLTQLDDAWRKPRLAIDAADRVYATIDHDQPREVWLHVVDDGIVIANDVVVGVDNSGSIAIDSSELAHLSWRGPGSCGDGQTVYHNTFSLVAGAGTSECLHSSSDFSWVTVDLRDDSVHLVNTVPNAQGINYQVRQQGAWGTVQTLALAETQDEPEPDNVGPTIAVDVVGTKYIAFSGALQVPYVLVIDADGQDLPVMELDPEDHTTAGGKFHNPNVGCHPERLGACVAWYDDPTDVVYVRCLGTAL